MRLIDTVSTADYDGELKELLAALSGGEFMSIAFALDRINVSDFEEQLRLAALV